MRYILLLTLLFFNFSLCGALSTATTPTPTTTNSSTELEKIQTSSLIVLKNIVASIQLAMALSRTVYNQTNSFKDVSKIVLSNRFISRFKRHSQSL